MSNVTDTELLVQLLDGELTDPARRDLLERIEREPELQKEWEMISRYGDLLKAFGEKKKIAGIHQEMMTERKAATVTEAVPSVEATSQPTAILRELNAPRRYFIYAARSAAAIILLVLVATLYPYFSSTPGKLFGDQFAAYSTAAVRGTETTALEADYQAGNWSKTIADYRHGSFESPKDHFLAANAFLQLNDPAAAVTALQQAAQANDHAGTHFLEPDIQYYLGLAYLAAGKPQSALPLFHQIYADDRHPYHEKISWWFLRKLNRLAADKKSR